MGTVVAALCLLLPAGGASAQAGGDRRCHDEPAGAFALTAGPNEKAAPATDGAVAVWGEKVDGVWGIYMRDAAPVTERCEVQTRLVATCGSRPASIAISAGKVVWQEGQGAGGSVWLAKASRPGSARRLATSAGEPAIAAPLVVWVDSSRDPAGDIVGVDLGALHEGVFDIAVSSGSQRHPAVSDQLVAWQDDGGGGWDIRARALDGDGPWSVCRTRTRCEDPAADFGEPFDVVRAAGAQTLPAVSGDVVVWQDGRGDDLDIWAAWAAEVVDEACWVRSAAVRPHEPASQREIVVRAVCAAAGHQRTPTVAGTIVWWADERGADSDIRAYDLAAEQSAVVCGEDGDQVAPSAGDDAVVWLDGRAGGGRQDVYFSDEWSADGGDGEETPPCAPEWTDERIVTLFLSVFDDLGIFEEVCFSLDDGETYTDWQPLSDVVRLPLPDGDGRYRIAILFRTADGSEFGPVTVTVRVDTKAPRARTMGKARVKRGGKARLAFSVRDNMSPTADVTVWVRDRRGKVVRSYRVDDARTGRRLAVT
ncbi:MAG: hypothetical protein FJ000_09710, partial [Actinobacteria bacterium]|nr:hypothetical protein [Actinomycetota bacterium]